MTAGLIRRGPRYRRFCAPALAFACCLPLIAAQVKPGQIVKLMSRDQIPADCVLLATSEPNGRAYVETSGLDGETNLKTKQAKEFLWNEQGAFSLSLSLFSAGFAHCILRLR